MTSLLVALPTPASARENLGGGERKGMTFFTAKPKWGRVVGIFPREASSAFLAGVFDKLRQVVGSPWFFELHKTTINTEIKKKEAKS